MTARWLEGTAAIRAAQAWDDPLGPFLAALVADGPQPYVTNAHAQVHVLEAGGALFPVTVAESAADNTYVVSARSHFARYPRDEVSKLPHPLLRRTVTALIEGADLLLTAGGIDRTVFAHNWLLSTNLWPALAPGALAAAVRALRDRFPDRPFAFRSLDALGSADALRTLAALGARLVPARMVYYQDPTRADSFRLHSLRRDLKLLRTTPYRLVRPTPADAPRIADLYRQLYLTRHSFFNPQFTPAFFARALAEGWLDVQGFAREDGRLDAVLGVYRRGPLQTQPLFGYEHAVPRAAGLYRLLSAQKLVEAQRRGLLVHASAGAGAFKAARGGVPTPEYLAVFDGHLPRHQRWPWALVAGLGQRIGLPLLRRYAL